MTIGNFHTHTTFSDGKNTAEEMVLAAIEKGFLSVGFSDHGYTPYDLRYCMKDFDGYVKEINRLKEKYKGKIQIYLGIEEDSRALVDRTPFDYLIGSCHYVGKDDEIYPFDSNYGLFSQGMALFGGDGLALAEHYFRHFSEYILQRKPDVVGHFDLISKYEEMEPSQYFGDSRYWMIAEKYLLEAMKSGAIFEVNTGSIARGFRVTPYPHERLLRLILKNGGRVTVSSDSHKIETLDGDFALAISLLKEVGFKESYALYDGKWQPFAL
ncbi:MAG: histidinol-phosphatase [Clostridia bacterium]|nr:histidinol-phosphatase [Clostridia bacterium]